MLVAISLISLAPAAASAQGRLRWNLRLGADFGGEQVVQFQYSDGSTPEMVAGSGIVFGVGGAAQVFQARGHRLDLQTNLGFKYRTIPPADNQSADWTRFPVEGLLMYRSPRGFRLGGGVAAHLANTLEASGAVLNDKVTFKPKPGWVVQAEWMFARWSLDARYTAMDYTVESGGSGTVGASGIGGGLTYWFGVPKAKDPLTVNR